VVIIKKWGCFATEKIVHRKEKLKYRWKDERQKKKEI